MQKKAWKTSKNQKHAKIITKIPKTTLLSWSIQQATYVTNLYDLYWFMWPKSEFDLLLAVK